MNEKELDKMKSKSSLYILTVMLIAAIFILTICINQVIQSSQKIKNFTPITAIVVDHEPYDGAEGVTYAEVIQFTVDGVTYTVTNDIATGAPVSIGQKVNIYYNPDNPNECVFTSTSKYIIFFIIFVAVWGSTVLFFLVKNIIKYCKCLASDKRNATNDDTQDNQNNRIIL